MRLTDRPDMTLDVYRGRKTTTTVKSLMQTAQKLNVYSIFYKLPECLRGQNGPKSLTHIVVVVVVLLFYVHVKHLRSCWDGHIT